MLCTTGFVHDVTFSHNGANGPESKTTRMFRPVRQVAVPGAKNTIYDWILFSYENSFSVSFSFKIFFL